jgi:uncharacterized surface protein with fasciclin (FAS1) repeats
MNMANIVETATSAGTFRTLCSAVEAAGLVGVLSGPGPWTVFAPTDEAFDKLPEGTIERLLKDVPKLKDILTYHVVQGSMMASDVCQKSSLKTVQGGEVSVDATEGCVVGGAKVIQADIEADNGVIHVIDGVMMPPGSR